MPQEQDAGGDRQRRSEPTRTGPKRTGFSDSAAASEPAALTEERPLPDADGPPGPAPEAAEGAASAAALGEEPGVHEVVAHAVRLGYDVIGENLRQGRDAADRMSAGVYKARHAKQDLEQVSRRILHLARDLGVTGFDLLGAVLRDPKLEEVVRRRPLPAEPPTPAPADRHAPIKVGCVLRGNSRATADPLLLTQPERPSTLAIAGLHSHLHPERPLLDITFLASNDGQSIMALIQVPEDQPTGVYNGVVCDGLTHAPLGTLTVKVAG